jgi:phage tail-like protein
MARVRLIDRLQNFRFHLLDATWELSVPPFALNPLAGFQAITAPEITLETEEYNEGNHWTKRHLPTTASVGNITLSRGCSFYDAEFWVWMSATIRGQQGGVLPPTGPALSGHRRNLLLIQYTGYSMRAAGNLGPAVDAAVSAAAGFMPSPNAVLGVPARAWFLMECMPVRYKAASDFEASSSDVSVAELEISVDRWEEVGVAA